MDKLKQWLWTVVLAVFVTLNAWAEPTAPVQTNLKNVREALDDANRALLQKKRAKSQLESQVGRTSRALFAEEKRLATIERDQKKAADEWQELQNQLLQNRTRVENLQAEVSRLMAADYRNRSPNSLILLLQQRSVNEKGRLLTYMRYIHEANRQVMVHLLDEKQQLAMKQQASDNKLAQIQELARQHRAMVKKLAQRKGQQEKQLRSVQNDIAHYARKVRELRSDEQQLSALVRRLGEEKQAARARQTQGIKVLRLVPPAETKSASEMVEIPVTTPFSRLQGQLSLPVAGQVAARFGEKRTEGSVWRGMFIRAKSRPVSAIAAGEVAYTGQLRGYGLTVIIDHDGTYLSVYTGLASVKVTQGEKVMMRQTLGVSGALPDEGDEGLYFEIRYRTRPLNPQTWFQ